MQYSEFDIKSSQLGRNTSYANKYAPELLFAIPRRMKKEDLNLRNNIKFYGVDIWNAYEVSWLNLKGVPNVRIAEIKYDANSEYMIESKSLKLYLNSFNSTNFQNEKDVCNAIKVDLSKLLGAQVYCVLYNVEDQCYAPQQMQGVLLDNMDIDMYNHDHNNIKLNASTAIISENIYTHLLKSNCLVTHQPDFGSLMINYHGRQIDHESILRYIISLRDLNEFHEHCVERIFWEIYNQCHPKRLTVSARYTRRGGIDINPIRSSEENFRLTMRSMRQ